jgi:hypothetical protein
MENFNTIVTVAGSIFGALILLAALAKLFDKSLPNKWPTIGVMGIGAFLLMGSQYKSFKVSADGLEALRNDISAAADATDKIAAQVEETATAAAAAQNDVESLAGALESRSVVPPQLTAPIRARTRVTPTIDMTQIQKARATLARIRAH